MHWSRPLHEPRIDLNCSHGGIMMRSLIIVFSRGIAVAATIATIFLYPVSSAWSSDCPLCGPAQRGDVAEIKRLIQAGADVNAHDQRTTTPLQYTVIGGHTEATRLLIENGAAPDLPDGMGNTPLGMALHL